MPQPIDALVEARSLLVWYDENSRASRVRFQVSEVDLLVVAATVPIVGILYPHGLCIDQSGDSALSAWRSAL